MHQRGWRRTETGPEKDLVDHLAFFLRVFVAPGSAERKVVRRVVSKKG